MIIFQDFLIENFCNIVNVFAITYKQFNVIQSLQFYNMIISLKWFSQDQFKMGPCIATEIVLQNHYKMYSFMNYNILSLDSACLCSEMRVTVK